MNGRLTAACTIAHQRRLLQASPAQRAHAALAGTQGKAQHFRRVQAPGVGCRCQIKMPIRGQSGNLGICTNTHAKTDYITNTSEGLKPWETLAELSQGTIIQKQFVLCLWCGIKKYIPPSLLKFQACVISGISKASSHARWHWWERASLSSVCGECQCIHALFITSCPQISQRHDFFLFLTRY